MYEKAVISINEKIEGSEIRSFDDWWLVLSFSTISSAKATWISDDIQGMTDHLYDVLYTEIIRRMRLHHDIVRSACSDVADRLYGYIE